ncbi:MAG: sensor histidine kinase [Oscillibacter sp.]|nr:sensor histidine kinase [Oscillibacter sp.]
MKRTTQFFHDLKIKQKIQLFGMVSLLLLCVVFSIFYGAIASNTILQRTKAAAQSNLQQIASYMENIDIAVSTRLSHLDTSISVQKFMSSARQGQPGEESWSIDALLQDIQSAEQIDHLALYTPEGRFVAGTNTNPDFEQVPDEAVFTAVRARPDGNYWHDDAEYSNTRTSCISIYRAIRADGVTIGIVRAQLNTAALSNLHYYVGFSGTSDIYIFSNQGNVLLRETAPAMLRVGRESFADHAGGGQTPELYMFRQQKYLAQGLMLDPYNLYAVSVVSYAELMEDVRTCQMMILLLGVVCLGVQLLFFSLMGDSLSRPIIALSQEMIRVGDGEMNLRINNQNKDEIGILSRSFDGMLDHIQQLMAENTASEKRRHELEMISLQTQITPHFLYNSLDSVSALAQMGDTGGAFQMSKALSEFYRGVLSDGRSVITVEEELKMTDSYLRVQAQRYQDGFEYSIDIVPELLSASIVKLTIQPLVENAIYHGIRNVRRRGCITITGRRNGGEMVLTVADNGKGMATDATPITENHEKGDLILRRKGYGMFNADQRIKLCFGKQYGLRVESVPEIGTRVEIRAPFCPYKGYQHDLGFDCR